MQRIKKTISLSEVAIKQLSKIMEKARITSIGNMLEIIIEDTYKSKL